MKLLLDECLPEDLKGFISGHQVFAVSDMGWKGIKNGELMKRAVESGFDVFLTADKNLPKQQNVSKYQLAIIVFDVFRNTLPALKPKLPRLYELLNSVEKARIYLC
jgi:predicted nuclease of predicted toxin-antitoxin system